MRDVSMVTTSSRIGWRTVLSLLFAAMALRGWDLGNPVIHVDEQWYLLVGDRMLAGAVPYVDILDRKPIGLFLLFAAVTALIVAATSRPIGLARHGAAIAGVVHFLSLALLGGRGGEGAGVYHLPMAAAGWLTITAFGRSPRGVLTSRAFACAFTGIALQMKYTPAVEGAFFGIAHLDAAGLDRRSGARAVPGDGEDRTGHLAGDLGGADGDSAR